MRICIWSNVSPVSMQTRWSMWLRWRTRQRGRSRGPSGRNGPSRTTRRVGSTMSPDVTRETTAWPHCSWERGLASAPLPKGVAPIQPPYALQDVELRSLEGDSARLRRGRRSPFATSPTYGFMYIDGARRAQPPLADSGSDRMARLRDTSSCFIRRVGRVISTRLVAIDLVAVQARVGDLTGDLTHRVLIPGL